MKQTLKYLLFSLCLTTYASSYAQFDTLNTVLKPRIGVGTGTLSYFGEIQKYQSGFSSTINRMGGNVMINAPLNKYLNVEFQAVYGKVSANERSLERNFNFQSRIRMGSLSLQYNFYPFFSPTRSFFNPYLALGITTFEFLSKTDLYNGNGEKYYYWSDGSIMNLAETDPQANEAKPLIRDYKYETDLRETNLDSLGKYKEQSFAIPISFGAEFHLTERVDFRIGTTLNYTFTDLIDNISQAGEGPRKGDKRNDFLLYSNIGLSYDLEKWKKEEEIQDFEKDSSVLADFDQSDWDKDGVIDAFDACFDTPLEALVDSYGCPIDTDKDGVADYLDEEVTPKGNYVNEYGITITKEDFLRQQALMMDSTGLAYGFEEIKSYKAFKLSESAYIEARAKGPENKNYVVIIGKNHKNISANQLHQYLGFKEFETITRGDTVYYVMGKYERIEDAVAAKTSLENQGVMVDNIGKQNRGSTDISSISNKVIEKIEKINEQEGKELPNFNSEEPSFRIQIGSFKKPINIEKVFPGIKNITFAKGQDGLTRYYSGVFSSYQEATKAASEPSLQKIKDRYVITAYMNQKRATLKEAGVKPLPNSYNEQGELSTFVEPRDTDTTINQSKIDESKLRYQILLGSYGDNIPVDDIQIFLSIGGIKPVKDSNGTKYYSKKVKTKSEANELLKEYGNYNLKDIHIVAFYKGKYYTLEELEKEK